MNRLEIRVDNPDDLLDSGAFGAAAKVRLEWSADGVTYAELSTQTIVSGDQLYVFYHQAGLISTWYRSRYSNSAGSLFSDYSSPFRVKRGWTALSRLKTLLKIPAATTTDDDRLREAAEAANSWLDGEIGMFLGPSPDTSRTLDVVDRGEVFIPGGIRTLTTLELRETSGGAWSTVTAADVLLRPHASARLPGLEADRIVFVDVPTGSYSRFYTGREMVRVTGTFGPAEPPASLVRIADTIGVWLYQSQQAGSAGIIGSLDTGEIVVNRVLTPLDFHTIRRYRHEVSSFSWV